MKLWVIVLIFLVIGSFLIVKSNDLDLESDSDRSTFLFKFSHWAGGLFGNGKAVVGHAIAMDWLPENEENSTNE